jgi:hypothetical protein
VGSYTNTAGEFGFEYSNGIYSTILCPGAIDGNALGTNDGGSIVGDCIAGGHDNGFLYSSDTYIFVDVPFHTIGEAIGINDSDQIVGFTGEAVPEPSTFSLLLCGTLGLVLLKTQEPSKMSTEPF